MPSERGERILGALLMQGRLPWDCFTTTLASGSDTADDLLRRLVEDGVISETELAGLESTQGSFHPEAVNPDATVPGPPLVAPRSLSHPSEAHARLLTALAIPQWRQYRNLRFIGEGGMGRIYKGYDGSLRRMVALKFLRRMEPHLVARFMKEAQLQAGLEHPHICRVYEVGDWQGQAYIAMQFVRGETLDACQSDLSLRESVQVMATVAGAVHFAHRQGLIHRDLKPANIMVERPDVGEVKPYILDFGLARGLENNGFTVDGQIIGTYHFMAPEQARGANSELDRRTDVYALGATLYNLIVGKPPFWDSEGFNVLNRTLGEEPVPPSQMVPGLPSDLETIVLKCLEKEPAQRYESARALEEDLRRFLDEEPILARRPTLRYRAEKYARKHKAMVAASALALVAILAAGGVAVTSWATARARAQYAQEFGQEAERLEAMVRYIHLLPSHDIRGEMEAVRERLAALSTDVRKAGGLAAGPGAYALGRGFMALGDPASALRSLQEALNKGFDGPDLRFALGRVQGHHYLEALDTARRYGDPSFRKAEEARADREWRQPALANLKLGAHTASQGQAFDQALLEFYGGNHDRALELTREAHAQAPWFYEAKKLEADILHAQAMVDKDYHQALVKLEKVVPLLEEARRVAPSDPALPIGIAKIWRDHILKAAYVGGDTLKALEACGQTTQEALNLDASLAEADIIRSNSWNYAAMDKSFRRVPAREELRQALQHAENALRLQAENRDALIAMISAHSRSAFQCLTEKVDPVSEINALRPLVAKVFAIRPADPIATAHFGSALRYRFTFLSQQGLDPQVPLNEAIPLFDQAIKRYPEILSLQSALGQLHIEHAEHLRKMGKDPAPVANLAIELFENIIKSDPNNFLVLESIGTAKLICADALSGQGLNPLQLLIQAENKLTQVLNLNKNKASCIIELCEIQLIRGYHNLHNNISPKNEIDYINKCANLLTKLPGNQPIEILIRLDLLECQYIGKNTKKFDKLIQRALNRIKLLESKNNISIQRHHLLRCRYHLTKYATLRTGVDHREYTTWISKLNKLQPNEPETQRIKKSYKLITSQ